MTRKHTWLWLGCLCWAGCARQTSDALSPTPPAPGASSAQSEAPQKTAEARIAERELRAESAANGQAVTPSPSADAASAPTNPPASSTPAKPVPADPVPPLVDDTGAPLPQTEERPSAESESFRRRLQLLVEAIEHDDHERALPAFFPVQAYAQVKAIAKPERDWEWRLVGAFRRNIHEYHKQLGAAANGVKFVGIEIAEDKVKWMKPHSEGNRLGYYRVLRSTLVVEDAEARQRKLEITSLISWRGQWYVVHLHGFK